MFEAILNLMRVATLIFRAVNTDKKKFKNLLILNVLT